MLNVLKIRVLLDYENDVFRDFLVPDNVSFEALHEAILNAFNFPNNQMASFYMSNLQWDKGEEIPLFDMNEDFGSDTLPIMNKVKISEKLHTVGQKMVYVYDFMLMWCFYVDVLEIDQSNQKNITIVNSYGNPPKANSKKGDLNFNTEKEASKHTNDFELEDPDDLDENDDDDADNPFYSDEFDDFR